MGRELQKRKKRSSIAKVIPRKPKKTKRQVLANHMIAENWDKDKTVSQNYAALGLTRRLNGPTGGIERHILPSTIDPGTGIASAPKKDSLAIDPSPVVEIAPQEALIERDPTTGAILRIINDPTRTAEDDDAAVAAGAYKPLRDPLNKYGDSAGVADGLAKALNPGDGAARKRGQSAREEEWIRELVARYGASEEQGSFEAMARDRVLNARQQSVGDLRRRVRKYLDARG